MFYITDVGDKTSEMIHILETTALAFQIVIDAIYHSKGSLQKKTVKVGKWSKQGGGGSAEGLPWSKPLNRIFKKYSECPETQNKHL